MQSKRKRESERERERESPSRASEFVRRDKKLLTQVDLKLGPDSELGRGRFSMMKQKRFGATFCTVSASTVTRVRLNSNACDSTPKYLMRRSLAVSFSTSIMQMRHPTLGGLHGSILDPGRGWARATLGKHLDQMW